MWKLEIPKCRNQWQASGILHSLLPYDYSLYIRSRNPCTQDESTSAMIGARTSGETNQHQYNRFKTLILQGTFENLRDDNKVDKREVDLSKIANDVDFTLVAMVDQYILDLPVSSFEDIKTCAYPRLLSMVDMFQFLNRPKKSHHLSDYLRQLFQNIGLPSKGDINVLGVSVVDVRLKFLHSIRVQLLERIAQFENLISFPTDQRDLVNVFGCQADSGTLFEDLTLKCNEAFVQHPCRLNRKINKSQLIPNFEVMLQAVCHKKSQADSKKLKYSLFRLERFIQCTSMRLKHKLRLAERNISLGHDLCVSLRRLSCGKDTEHQGSKLPPVTDPAFAFLSTFNESTKLNSAQKAEVKLAHDLLRICQVKNAAKVGTGVALRLFRCQNTVSNAHSDTYSTDNIIEHQDTLQDKRRISNRVDTHSYKPCFDSVQHFLSCIQAHNLPSLSDGLLRTVTAQDRGGRFLAETRDRSFPTVTKNRHLSSWSNGTFIASMCRFVHYADPTCSLPPKLLVLKHHPKDTFDSAFYHSVLSHFRNNAVYLPCENSHRILRAQKWTKGVCLWFHILLGRMRWAVGAFDNWQVALYFKGLAGNGKSFIMDILSLPYEKGDIGQLSTNVEVTFGLSAFYESLIVLGRDMGEKLQLPQTCFNSMVTGELISIARKFQNPISQRWKSQLAFAGNVLPGYTDKDFSFSRRMLMFFLDEVVQQRDPELFSRFEASELPCFMLKTTMLYFEAVGKWRQTSVWQVIDSQFLLYREMLLEQSNILEGFIRQSCIQKSAMVLARMHSAGVSRNETIPTSLENCRLIIEGADMYQEDGTGHRTSVDPSGVPAVGSKVFWTQFALYAKSRQHKATILSKDLYGGIFAKYGILECEQGMLYPVHSFVGVQI